MGRKLEPAILVEEPPEVEFRGGVFYVRDGAGCRAMLPTTFFVGFQNASKAMQDYWARPEGEVVEFPRLAESG